MWLSKYMSTSIKQKTENVTCSTSDLISLDCITYHEAKIFLHFDRWEPLCNTFELFFIGYLKKAYYTKSEKVHIMQSDGNLC